MSRKQSLACQAKLRWMTLYVRNHCDVDEPIAPGFTAVKVFIDDGVGLGVLKLEREENALTCTEPVLMVTVGADVEVAVKWAMLGQTLVRNID